MSESENIPPKEWCSFATMELSKCQMALNDTYRKYNKLLGFIEELADESIYDRYENLNELNWVAFELLKEIGEV